MWDAGQRSGRGGRNWKKKRRPFLSAENQPGPEPLSRGASEGSKHGKDTCFPQRPLPERVAGSEMRSCLCSLLVCWLVSSKDYNTILWLVSP